jgi:hypothetical protein
MGKSDPYIEISKNMPDMIYSAPEKGEIRFIKFPIGSEITFDIRYMYMYTSYSVLKTLVFILIPAN